MHHGHFSKHVLELVYTEYEVHRSIILHGRPIQLIPPQNLVFGTLTAGIRLQPCNRGETTDGLRAN